MSQQPLTTAVICDALLKRADVASDVAIFPTEFPIFTQNMRIEGRIRSIPAGGDDNSRREAIADALSGGFVVLIENEGRLDCSCFEDADLNVHRARPVKSRTPRIIVNGAVRSSSVIAKKDPAFLSLRALSVHPMPFSPPTKEVAVSAAESFPFGQGGYVVGDGDGLIVLRDEGVLARLGLADRKQNW